MKPGDRIADRYEVLRELGRGGSAAVYLVRDDVLNRDVALKMMHGHDAGEAGPDLQAEAQLVAQLHHPGIVTVHDCGAHESAPFLVMELVEGDTLTDILEDEQPCLRETVKMGMMIADAMAYAHDKGAVHRDLTLNNIMVAQNGDGSLAVKVLDFGLGKLVTGVVDVLADFRIGTARFMPPEQFRGEETDERSDIYSFGVCLYRLLAERFPFDEQHKAALEYQVLNEAPPTLPGNVPGDLAELVLQCLEKDPARRPPGFREIALKLEAVTLPVDDGDEPGAGEPCPDPLPRTGNPFLNRVMIKDMRDFVGRRREARKIFARLDALPPQSISIVGDRRIGKSSLLSYLNNANNRRRHMTNAADAVFVFLDFQSDIDFTTGLFLKLMLKSMPAACLDRHAAVDAPTVRDLEKAVTRLDGQGKRLIVLMDEFEKITGNANFEQGFFSFLRHLANHYKVSYVTSSEHELMQMCHAREISDSPFFNIFSNLPLGPFTREEAHDLVVRFSAEAGHPLQESADEIVAVGGRIPMYLQMVCSIYFEEAIARPGETIRWDDVKTECMSELRPHFQYIWDRMPSAEKDVLSNLATGGRISPQQQHISEALRRRGLVKMEDGRPEVFSRAFAEFLGENGVRGGGWLKGLFGRGR